MSYAVSLTVQAKDDLIAICKYIAEDLQSPQNAQAQLLRLEKEIASLSEMPERFRLYDYEKRQDRNLRMMPVDNYLVFYEPKRENDTVTVIRIMYGGRNISRELKS